MTKPELLRTFLEERGIRVSERATSMVSCINATFHHRGDRRPSAVVNMGGRYAGRYHCFSCGLSGDAYDLLMAEQSVDFATAKRMLGGMESYTPEPTWI